MALADEGGGSSRRNPSAAAWDNEKGTWSFSTSSSFTGGGGNTGKRGGGRSSGGSSASPKRTSAPASGESNLKASNTDKDTSAGATDKKYNTIEYNTLEGELTFIATEETIKMKAGDTITLEGLGKYLSGNYYVVSVSRDIASDGYSHTAKVIRTDFGDSLKSGSTTETKDGAVSDGEDQGQTEKVSSSASSSTAPQKTYTVKKGDCLWNIAKQEYGSGKSWKKIYDANTGQVANPNLIYPGQKLVLP